MGKDLEGIGCGLLRYYPRKSFCGRKWAIMNRGRKNMFIAETCTIIIPGQIIKLFFSKTSEGGFVSGKRKGNI
jgi:hypothetical protein